MLPPGEHLEATVDADDRRRARRRVCTRCAPNSRSPASMPIPASWRQVVEDVCVISVGETTDQVLRLLAEPQAVDVAAGGTATLSVTVGTDAYADLAAEAHLISPWGTWEWLGPCVVGAEIPARGSVVLDFEVAPPASVEPGEWWALIRIACAGHLLYTPAVKVSVASERARGGSTVGGAPVLVSDVDLRETRLRTSRLATALPRPGTSEGRQLRRWLTQLVVTERVVAGEAAARDVTADGAPTEDELLPDVAARLEIGSVAASALEHPLARALFADVTADVHVSDVDVADYHARNPFRFAAPAPAAGGWHEPGSGARAGRRPGRPSPSTCWRPHGVAASASGSMPGARRWSNWRRATNIPAIPASPTTPTNTDDGTPTTLVLDVGGTKIAAGLVDADGTLVHRAQQPTPDGDAETVWAVAEALIADALEKAGGDVAGGRHLLGRAHRSAQRHRQPDQHHRVATVSDRRTGGRRRPAARSGSAATACAWHSASGGAAQAGARTSCSAWWSRPASAAGWYSTAPPTTGAPAMPATSATSSSNPTACRAPAADAAASRPSRPARTWRGGPARTAGTRPPEADAKELADAANAGDPDRAAGVPARRTALAMMIASVAAVCDLDLVVIGGGVAKSGALLFDPLREALTTYAGLDFIRGLRVLPAELGGDAGLVGAAALVRS